MDYDDVLARVIDLLQRDKRVPYRALKRRFDLDDNYIEDLKIDIIEAKQLAVDENDRILVWMGDTAAASASAPTQPSQPAVEPRAPDAERRQLTVMFCDLADSTKLSGQLDPEDLRDVIRAYQQTCATVIERYEGHIAQYLGDGLLVYFGWPLAHEDDAQRGAHVGLGILEAMSGLNDHLRQEKGVQLTVRIGLHTGPVVIGEMGGGGRHEQLALGETTNIAARLEGLAAPNTVVISETTYRLVEGYFVCKDLGSHDLRGVAASMQTYRVTQATGVQSRLDVGMVRGLTPFVGREQEVGLLLERWAQAKEGAGHVILLSGEAGLGKSRLAQAINDHVAEDPHTRLECHSSPYYQHTSFYPITNLLQHILHWQSDDTPDEKRVKLEQMLDQNQFSREEMAPLFASLLSLPLPEEQYPPLPWTPQIWRQKTLEATVTMLLKQAERRPVLFILEDLHWTDPSTLELLGLLIKQAPTVSLFILLTCRPEFESPWGLQTHLTPIVLHRFTRPQIETMAVHVTHGKRLPEEVIQHLVEKSDGVPLYMEEMTKAILESEVLSEAADRYELARPLASLTIPATLQDSLMARLDRLEMAKGIAQLGATIGRQFDYALLHAISSMDEETLQRELDRLVEAELLYQRGLGAQSTYSFKHALIRDAAYQSLLRRTRQAYHQRIAQRLEERFPETAASQPEILAHHYTEAACPDQAIGYWRQAGQAAARRSANQEAVRHLSTGLELLSTRPDTPARTQQELALHMALGPVLMATRGWSADEVEQTYSRAWALCQQLGEASQGFPALRGLLRVYQSRGRLPLAREVAEQLLSLAQRQDDATHLLSAHVSLGHTLAFMGTLSTALPHLEQGIALSDPEAQRTLALRYGQAPGVQCLVFAAFTLWCLGAPDQGLARSQAACILARELGHTLSLAAALFWAARLHLMRGEAQAAQEQAEALIALSTEHTLPVYVATGRFTLGWALAAQGQAEAGVTLMRQGLAGVQATGGGVSAPTFLPVLAAASGRLGQVDAGMSMLSEALALTDQTGVRWYEAEAYRIKGNLLLRQAVPDAAQAEACFQQAIAIAQTQSAKSWELRAATSLARLWQSQGKDQDAYDLLAPVYHGFTEGFDTADLQDAKALLVELETER